jgi:hypothetical protein
MDLLAREHRGKVSLLSARRQNVEFVAMLASSEDQCFVKPNCLAMIYYNKEVNYIKVAGQIYMMDCGSFTYVSATITGS